MGSPLDSTFGIWLVTVWIQTLLQGCGLLQGWLYFHWYSKDHWGLKTMVAALLVIETFQIVDFFQITYFYFVDGFGDLHGLFLIHWQDSAQLLATCLSGFIVQVYFGYCIYILNKKNKIIPVIIALLAVAQIGFGITQTIITVRLVSFDQLDSTKVISTLQAVFALLCDLMITGSLVQYLAQHKTSIRSTNNMLTSLMIIAVNRGVLTALCALLNLTLFLARPGTFYFFIGLELSGKLYMNSALATLNSRQHVVKKAHEIDGTDWTSNIRMGGISRITTTMPATDEDNRIQILVTRQSDRDNGNYDLKRDHKDVNIVDGMI